MSTETIPETLGLRKLTQLISDAEVSEIGYILKNNNVDWESIEPYCKWNNAEYTRNCLKRTNKLEIILLCWEPGQITKIHNHNGQKCWVHQLLGQIHENKFKLNSSNCPELAESKFLNKGGCSYIDDEMGYHNLENKSSNRSVSLHIYINPIDECLVYNDNEDCFKKKELTYKTNWNL